MNLKEIIKEFMEILPKKCFENKKLPNIDWFFENEKRTIFGLMPLPELEGKRYMSLNWIDANDASQYQVGKVNVDVLDENKTEDVVEE